MNVIREHWNERAALGATAGTQDLIAKELEQRAILDALQPWRAGRCKLLEVGCGRGELARRVATVAPSFDIVAIDNAESMIQAAGPSNPRLLFRVADVLRLPSVSFDVVMSERMLINLPTWELQHQAIQAIALRLKLGGQYLMCENSQDGLDAINATRARLDLTAIQSPWHNRYLRNEELAQVTCLKLLRCIEFSSTYYFLSRIINAKLAQAEGREPAYDAPINQLALTLSSVGPWAQNRLWIWEKP